MNPELKIPPLLEWPPRIVKLPRDPRGYPIPWFTLWVNGEPDFRVMNVEKVFLAHKFGLCWICGEPRGRNLSFVMGPMSVINKISGEPPSHRDCAQFAVKVCPFLTRPKMKRNQKDLPKGLTVSDLTHHHNPGITAIWETRDYRLFVQPQQPLMHLGSASKVEWYSEGRLATADEVAKGLEQAWTRLTEIGEETKLGPLEREEMVRKYVAAQAYIPNS